MTPSYRIVFPSGFKETLKVAFVVDNEYDDWDMASRRMFFAFDDAYDYMVELAKKHGLGYERKRNQYLD